MWRELSCKPNKNKEETKTQKIFIKKTHLRSVLIVQIISWYLGALSMFCEIQNLIYASIMQYARSYSVTKVNLMLQKQTRKRIII